MQHSGIKDLATGDLDNWKRIPHILLEPYLDLTELDYEEILDVANGIEIDTEKVFTRIIAVYKRLTDLQEEVVAALKEFEELSKGPNPGPGPRKNIGTVDVHELLAKGEIKSICKEELERYCKEKIWNLDKVLKNDYDNIRKKYIVIMNGLELCEELSEELLVLTESAVDVHKKFVEDRLEKAQNGRCVLCESFAGKRWGGEEDEMPLAVASELTASEKEKRMEELDKTVREGIMEAHVLSMELLLSTIENVDRKNKSISFQQLTLFYSFDGLASKFQDFIPPEHMESYR